MTKYIPTIGLEIHAELKTKSKMFCSCKNDPLENQPNVNICPVCMGHPGTLPTPNEQAINKVLRVGLALNCTIAENSKFDRKSYFYPDLPKGYQISQYDMPFCENGYLDVDGQKIGITRIHLEEDTARSQHPDGADFSLIDFNRAGVPLMELVTEPVIGTAQEASKFAQELQMILRYVDASEANMEKGQMRVEANVSIRPEGAKELGTKVEVKNLNSFRAVEGAINAEVERQTKILDASEKVAQETRGWKKGRGETFFQREKESAHDYRYFPEPDIPPFTFTPEFISHIKKALPELPQARKLRFQEQYSITENDVEILIRNKELGEYFERVISELRVGGITEQTRKLAVNYLISDLQGLLQGMSVEDEKFKISAENFAELIDMLSENKISTPAAKSLLKKMFETGGDPSQIIEQAGLAQQYDQVELEKIAREIIEKNSKAAEDYKKGKENALQFLVGQMMAKTRGSVNPETAREAILKIFLS